MTSNNDKLRIRKPTNKRKEKSKNKKQVDQKPNSIEVVTLEILQSRKSGQKLWLSTQDIMDGLQNKAVLIDYWNKSDEFKIDLIRTLSLLETKGKIEKKIFEQESYFSSFS